MFESPARSFTCNIAMVGLPGVGKTSLVQRYVRSIFTHDYKSTVSVDISEKKIERPDGSEIELVLWDLAGDDERRQLENSFLQHALAYILVADVTRPASLEGVVNLQARIRKILPRAPFVLALNKTDLPDWSVTGAQLAAVDPAWTVIHTSALSGKNVEEIFLTVADRVTAPAGEDSDIESDASGEEEEADPRDSLTFFLSGRPAVVMETREPLRIEAGATGRATFFIDRQPGGSEPESEHVVRCWTSAKGVRCKVSRREDADRVDAMIEVPDDMESGASVTVNFEIVGAWSANSRVQVEVA